MKEHGYSVIDTNYHCPEGEIDIVARHNDAIVFIEVRTRQNRRFGSPEESITASKKQKMRLAAARYREAHDGLPEMWRIDVVVVELRGGRPTRIELIENAVSDE